jgi:hypothetical protein
MSSMADWGKKSYRQEMSPSQQTSADFIVPWMNQAVKRAEGNPRNFGVLSEQANSPEQANRILNNSIFNNFARWLQAGQPTPFVDFMQQRWAPIGASNDPGNLNQNWAPNVRDALFDLLGPEEYARWKKYQMVMNQPGWMRRA